ncbi:polysaccharide deacetylase family protein [Roseospira marina]|uniref:Chitooligosaccharide deacetylase n=1 Tax=Roseospira marina TaxID=140057 RepID=A0A5M6IE98_9PROT|nr:polysaccharide deacetylase family protein [Roseospira marina]KAA5606606.1 polysaccharide deacetylase family protein [Roseospira marina]MBB4313992.1 peptidoglycan/xylan/chitin deacetylase (PgdA/CDA1 family) [Roseospira marina]MBB5087154.1 peptidoglycan/xylan/chitin deacetylase (PgdA/CDA1 family) [Roseospira marina]
MATVFLTFDDGPLAGTDDVIAVLNAEQVKGTLFMVGDHVSSAWRRGVLTAAHSSPFVQVANHSSTHAGGRYQAYYGGSAQDVLSGFNRATTTLRISSRPVDARLPGRNTWRAGAIVRTDPANGADSGAAATLLARNGYRVFGWDVEWRRTSGSASGDAGHPDQRADNLVRQIAASLGRTGGTMKPDKCIVLMHDTMFRASRSEGGGVSDRQQLVQFVQALKRAGHQFDIMSNYL